MRKLEIETLIDPPQREERPLSYWRAERGDSYFAVSEKKTRVRIFRSDTLETLRSEFESLSQEWHRDTDGYSSIQRKISHPAYLKVLSKGSIVVPLILRELSERPGHWFVALELLTGDNPVCPEKNGDMIHATKQWLAYGHQNKLI